LLNRTFDYYYFLFLILLIFAAPPIFPHHCAGCSIQLSYGSSLQGRLFYTKFEAAKIDEN
jgi:hypothetical protein